MEDKMEKKNRVMEMLKSLVSNIWYMVMLVAICTAVVVIILNWGKTMTALGRLIKILAPFIIGFFLAYLIKPLVALFKNLFNLVKRGSYMKVKKAAAVILSYIIIVGMIAIIIIYIAPQIRDSLKGIGHSVIRGYNYVSTHKEEMNAMIPFINLGDFMEYIKNNLGSRLLDQGEIVVPYVYEMSSSIAAVLKVYISLSYYFILIGIGNLTNDLSSIPAGLGIAEIFYLLLGLIQTYALRQNHSRILIYRNGAGSGIIKGTKSRKKIIAVYMLDGIVFNVVMGIVVKAIIQKLDGVGVFIEIPAPG